MCSGCKGFLYLIFLILICSLKLFAQTIPPEKGIWLSREEISALPVSGSGWNNVKNAADHSIGTPDLSNQDDPTNVHVLAKALVYVRLGDEKYRNEVIDACMAAINTENGGRTLALARELAAYVIAADLVGLPADKDQIFRSWLQEILTETLDGRTLVSTHEQRPNNWGTHSGASRAAVAVYLGDTAELARTAQVFKGYLGDRNSYTGFEYGDLSWQADPSKPVGINPKGATKNGYSIDGVIPDDMRRGGSFQFPPASTGYPWEGLQGVVAQAEILSRAGYDTWNWQDKAILRAVQFLYSIGWEAEGDDTWTPWLIDYHYGTNFHSSGASSPGKNMGWTDWTHQAGGGGDGSAVRVEGKVLDAGNSQPVDGATLQLKKGSELFYQTSSNSSGQFVFAAVEPGSYDLVCFKEGFETKTTPLDVAAGEETIQANLSLSQTTDNLAPDPPQNVRLSDFGE